VNLEKCLVRFCSSIDTVKWPHAFAVEIGTRVHTQPAAKVPEVLHPAVGLRTLLVALQASVDDVNGDAETWHAVGSLVRAVWPPTSSYDIVNVRDDVVSILVPKPQAGFEGDNVVRCHRPGLLRRSTPMSFPQVP